MMEIRTVNHAIEISPIIGGYPDEALDEGQ